MNNTDNDPSQVYYNVNMFNSSHIPVPASYNESRQTPLLTNPSKYYLSVIRFSIPGQEIPTFIAQALPYPNTDINKLVYSVTLTGTGGISSGPVNLEFNPNYNTVLQPIVKTFTPTNPRQNEMDPYYYVNSYQYMIDMINTALATAYGFLGGSGGTGSSTEPPYMTYDAFTGLCSLWAQTSYFQNADPLNTSNIIVWFNHALENFFPSFDYIFNGYMPGLEGQTGQEFGIFIKDNFNNNGLGNPNSPTGYYQMLQEYPTLFSWNVLQGISFRSNNIPVVFENSTGVSSTMGQSLQGSISGNQIAFVTDFEPINSGQAGIFRETIQYFPPGEYRLTDLVGTTPLSTIDLQAYWTDKYGNVHPIYIPPHNELTIKLLFRKKSFYSGVGPRG